MDRKSQDGLHESPAIGELSPRLRAATDRVRAGTNRAADWTREISTRRAQKSRQFEPWNPVYLLAAIALGIPILVMIPLILMNPGIH